MKIRTQNNKFLSFDDLDIDSYIVIKNTFCIHPMIVDWGNGNGSEKSDCYYTLTHIPTGHAICEGFFQKDLYKVAEELLSEIPLAFESNKVDSLLPYEKEIAREILRGHGEVLFRIEK